MNALIQSRSLRVALAIIFLLGITVHVTTAGSMGMTVPGPGFAEPAPTMPLRGHIASPIIVASVVIPCAVNAFPAAKAAGSKGPCCLCYQPAQSGEGVLPERPPFATVMRLRPTDDHIKSVLLSPDPSPPRPRFLI